MGRRGPPKTPTPILKLHGSHLAKSREGREPQPDKRRPTSAIALDDREKKVYRQVCDWLKDMGLQAVTDGNAIARYAKNVALYNDLAAYTAKHGEAYPIFKRQPDGTRQIVGMTRWPQSKQKGELEVTLLRLEREFGLTPGARASLQVDPKETNGDIESRYFG